jgi:hypothetical protein
LLAITVWPPNELNDFRAHENPSDIAMATSPTNASDIRYAVMMASLVRVRPQMQPTGLGGASVIVRSEATKHPVFVLRSWIASRSLSSGGAFAPTRWLAMTKINCAA